MTLNWDEFEQQSGPAADHVETTRSATDHSVSQTERALNRSTAV